MWGQNDVVEFMQWVDEFVVVVFGFFWEDVDGGVEQVFVVQCGGQCFDVYYFVSGVVDQIVFGFYGVNLFFVDYLVGGGGVGYVQVDYVGQVEQVVEVVYLFCVVYWQFGNYVVEIYFYVYGFCQY